MGLWYVIRFFRARRTGRAAAARGWRSSPRAGCRRPFSLASRTTSCTVHRRRPAMERSDTRFSIEYVVRERSATTVAMVCRDPDAACVSGHARARRAEPDDCGRNRRRDRRSSWLVSSVIVIWTLYFVYEVWDAWWYLRFLLPSYPFILVGRRSRWARCWSEGAGEWRPAAAGAGRDRRGAHFQIWTAVDRRAFDIWRDDRRAVGRGRDGTRDYRSRQPHLRRRAYRQPAVLRRPHDRLFLLHEERVDGPRQWTGSERRTFIPTCSSRNGRSRRSGSASRARRSSRRSTGRRSRIFREPGHVVPVRPSPRRR